MRTGWPIAICLCAAWVSVSTAQETKSVKTEQRSHSHHARPTRNANHAAAKPTKKTEKFLNQGPAAPGPAAEPEVTAMAAPVVEAAPLAEPVVVTYERGALGITTHGAPLREVLHKVQAATGAAVEAPDLEQRVRVTVAAEAPVQAIAALLDGMHLDYAMLGGTSVDDPVRMIIIAPRNGTASGRLATAAALDAAGIQGRTPGAIPSESAEGVRENAPAQPARRRD